MAKANLVDLNDIENVVDYGDQWTAIEINKNKRPIEILVKRWLNIVDRSLMISSIVDMAFSKDEEGHEEYRPHFATFAKYYNYIAFFTNVSIGDVSDENDSAEMLQRLDLLVRQTDIIEKIREAVGNDAYWRDLELEIEEAINYKKAVLSRIGWLNKILAGVNDLFGAVGEKVEDSDPKAVLDFLGESFPELKNELLKAFNNEVEGKT